MRSLVVGGVAATAAVLAVAVAPLDVVLGLKELTVSALLATGAWVSVRRLGVPDLSAAAAAGVGAYAGAVAPAVLGVPLAIGFVIGAAAGATWSAGAAALAARAGRILGALGSLAVGAAVVPALAALRGAGGSAGFHAVPLLTGSDTGDLAVFIAVLAVTVVGLDRWSRTRRAATAATSVRAPHVAASLGHSPTVAAARGGAVAGAVLGVGGVASGVSSGSVFPGAFDPTLAVALALAGLVGGRAAPAGAVGALVLWGPAVIWPTLGDATLLGTGLLALVLLVIRPDGLLPATPVRRPDVAAAPPRPRAVPTPLPMDLHPGVVVGIAGPNGSGKSTLLARLGGQLDGTATQRARAGVARTWQHPPTLHAGDALIAAIADAEDEAAAQWAADLLGPAAETPAGRDLLRLAARRPGLALLDEPSAHLDADTIVTLVHGLAEHGAAIVVAEHRREALDACDHIVRLDVDRPAAPPAAPTVPTRAPAAVRTGSFEIGPGEVVVVEQATCVALLSGPTELDGRRLPSRLHARVRRGLGVVGADDPVAADVTIEDHLAALGAQDLLDGAPLIAGRGDELAGVLSGGERRVLAWLRCIATRPRAVVLDRAGTGLDAVALAWAGDVVAAWRRAGVPVAIHPGRPEERAWSTPFDRMR